MGFDFEWLFGEDDACDFDCDYDMSQRYDDYVDSFDDDYVPADFNDEEDDDWSDDADTTPMEQPIIMPNPSTVTCLYMKLIVLVWLTVFEQTSQSFGETAEDKNG